MSKIKIIPTVMPNSYQDFVEKINLVYKFVDLIQIDVMDGKFVSSKSWPYNSKNDKDWEMMLNQDKGLPHWQKNSFEIDLMVSDQILEAEKWIEVGVSRIIGHISAFKDNLEIEKFIKLGNERGVEVSLAIAPDMPNKLLEDWVEKIDGVQFMGIQKVGYQGEQFSEVVLEKISDLHNKYPDLPISVDGGVSFETAHLLKIAGATSLASGSLIFNSNNPKDTIDKLKNF